MAGLQSVDRGAGRITGGDARAIKNRKKSESFSFFLFFFFSFFFLFLPRFCSARRRPPGGLCGVISPGLLADGDRQGGNLPAASLVWSDGLLEILYEGNRGDPALSKTHGASSTLPLYEHYRIGAYWCYSLVYLNRTIEQSNNDPGGR